MLHPDPCTCPGCYELTEAEAHAPELWEELYAAALGYSHEVAEVVAYLLDYTDVGDVLDAAREAQSELERDGNDYAARLLAEEVNAQC